MFVFIFISASRFTLIIFRSNCNFRQYVKVSLPSGGEVPTSRRRTPAKAGRAAGLREPPQTLVAVIRVRGAG